MARCMIISMARKTWMPDAYALLDQQQRESERITCEYCATSGWWTIGCAGFSGIKDTDIVEPTI